MQSVVINDELNNRRKAETITAYVSPSLKSSLERWAEEENRSVSSLITYLLTKAVESRQIDRESGEEPNGIESSNFSLTPEQSELA